MFLKNKNIIFKIRRSKVTDYAASSDAENHCSVAQVQSMDAKTQPVWVQPIPAKNGRQKCYRGVKRL